MSITPNMQSGGVNLPPPITAEQLTGPQNAGLEASHEALLPVPEVASQPAAGVSGMPAPLMPVPLAPTPLPPQTVVQSTTQVSTPAAADDTDLIEKEWVVRAKQIVEKTRNDPHVQSKEINILRADYMQKRYNKEIKLSD